MAIAHSGPVTGEPCQTDCSLAFASGRQAMVPPSDQALAPRTMEAWVKPTRDPWGWTPIVTRRPVWGLYLMASKESSAVLCFTDQGPPITSTSTVLADTWTHVACTDDGRHTRIYINGTEVLDKSHPARKQDPRVSVVDTPIEIGYDNNGRAHFAGAIAEVRLWDTVRTEDDISNSMERRLPGTEAGLVGYWPLDEAKGQTIRDLSKTFRRGWLGVTPNADDPADAVWIEGRPF